MTKPNHGAEQNRSLGTRAGTVILLWRRQGQGEVKETAFEKQLEEELKQHRIKELEKATGQQVVAEHEFHPVDSGASTFTCRRAGWPLRWRAESGRRPTHPGQRLHRRHEQNNEAQAMGIKVLRFTSQQLLKPKTMKLIEEVTASI